MLWWDESIKLTPCSLSGSWASYWRTPAIICIKSTLAQMLNISVITFYDNFGLIFRCLEDMATRGIENWPVSSKNCQLAPSRTTTPANIHINQSLWWTFCHGKYANIFLCFWPFKVIQGRRFWDQLKARDNSNLGPISHRVWDTATYWLKIANFTPSTTVTPFEFLESLAA